ncbi:MAG: dihydrofolate reductase [Chloroflexi bacterium]|nr:dihydrofolate reductase [Chloroflexota bacterium]
MGKVIFDISMSLDGFITGANQTPAEPLGDEGEHLHDWAFNSQHPFNRSLISESVSDTGAVICGRRTYDDSIPFWGPDGPTGAARLPLFIVTHHLPRKVPPDGVYTFVTDGIESALQQAKKAAGGKNISVMGGADIGQQYMLAGLVDELSIHLVPVLFGKGTPLFANSGETHIRLEPIQTVETPEAIHLRFRVAR